MTRGSRHRRLEIVAAGTLTTVQDLGRHGHSAQGISSAGAADLPALRLANALVGNAERAAALEFTLQGPTLHFQCDVEVALAGAPFDCQLDGEPVPSWAPVSVAAGATLKIGIARLGCRGYLAVGGGIDVTPVLGSRSQDINGGIGPLSAQALPAGTPLPLGPAPKPAVPGDTSWALAARCWTAPTRPLVLPLMPGSHTDSLDTASTHALFSQAFIIGVNSNRVGCRLEGVPLHLEQPLEMISEALLPGVVQLPPGGTPIALLCEAPTTGGYPRIGHISTLDLTRLAQLKPGDAVRFSRNSTWQARLQHVQRERALRALHANIAQRRRGDWP